MSNRVLCSEERKFVRTESMHPNYSRYSRFIVNNTASEINPQVLGLPLVLNGDNYEVVFAGAEATATAFGMEFQKYCIPAGERSQRKVLAIEHGPIVVSVEGLPDEDPNGDAYDKAALVAVLNAVAPKIRIADNTDNLMAQVP